MTPFPINRLLPRYAVDLPVQVVFHQGAEKLVVSGLGTDLSRNGMALYAGLNLKAGDPIEAFRGFGTCMCTPPSAIGFPVDATSVAEPSPPSGSESRHLDHHRVAHLPSQLLHLAEVERCGCEGGAGADAARESAYDHGTLYAGTYASETRGAEEDCRADCLSKSLTWAYCGCGLRPGMSAFARIQAV
jgi:hypothetical protein